MTPIDIAAMPHLLEMLAHLGRLLAIVSFSLALVIGAGIAWSHLRHAVSEPCAVCLEPACLRATKGRCPEADWSNEPVPAFQDVVLTSERVAAAQEAVQSRVFTYQDERKPVDRVVRIDLPPDLDAYTIKRSR